MWRVIGFSSSDHQAHWLLLFARQLSPVAQPVFQLLLILLNNPATLRQQRISMAGVELIFVYQIKGAQNRHHEG
jgi:hypothetical protein